MEPVVRSIRDEQDIVTVWLDVPGMRQDQRRTCAVQHDGFDPLARRAVAGRDRIGLRQQGQVAAVRMAHHRTCHVGCVDDRFERAQPGVSAIAPEALGDALGSVAQQVQGGGGEIGQRRGRARRRGQLEQAGRREPEQVAIEPARECQRGPRAHRAIGLVVEQHEQALAGHGVLQSVGASFSPCAGRGLTPRKKVSRPLRDDARMSHRIAVIQGHPDAAGAHYGHTLADAYAQGALAAGHALRRIEVAQIDFPWLRSKAEWEQGALPVSLQEAQAAIQWANHLVFVFPLWLGGMPALLKGFLEQVA